MTRRRCAILAGLVVGLLLLQASPAFAYKWKHTITVGVDPNGVPVKINATATGMGSAVGGSGRSDGPSCTIEPVSIGAGIAGLYKDKNVPADVVLFEVSCGTNFDFVWLRVGANGQPILPGQTVSPYQLALSARDRLPIPAGGIEANPIRSLTGLPTWFWYAGYNGRPLTKAVTAFGVTVQIQATPTAYHWDFGDGATMTSHDLGRAYPAHSDITHTYQTAQPDATVACTFQFAVRWRTPGGPWTALPPITRTATATLQVAQSQAVIGQ